MKKLLILVLVLMGTGCASGGAGVRVATRSDRVQVAPRNSSWWRQDVIVLFTNDCAPIIKLFAADHADESNPISVVRRGQSETVQLFRPFNVRSTTYRAHLLVKMYNANGAYIGSVDSRGWSMSSRRSGYHVSVTAERRERRGGFTCYLDEER